jgi:hypothetical protein
MRYQLKFEYGLAPNGDSKRAPKPAADFGLIDPATPDHRPSSGLAVHADRYQQRRSLRLLWSAE